MFYVMANEATTIQPSGNVMNKIFTLVLPVDNMMKSPVQNLQQWYVGMFLPAVLLYEHRPPMSLSSCS